MKTSQVKSLELNKKTIVELTHQTILEIKGGSMQAADNAMPSLRTSTISL